MPKKNNKANQQSSIFKIDLKQIKDQFLILPDLSGSMVQTRSLLLLLQSADNTDLTITQNSYFSIHDIDLILSTYGVNEDNFSSVSLVDKITPLKTSIESFLYLHFINQYLVPLANKGDIVVNQLIEYLQETSPQIFDLSNEKIVLGNLKSTITPPIKLNFYNSNSFLDVSNLFDQGNKNTSYKLDELVKDIYIRRLDYKNPKLGYQFKKSYPTIITIDISIDIEDIKEVLSHDSRKYPELYNDIVSDESKLRKYFGDENKKHLSLNVYIEDRFIPKDTNSFKLDELVNYQVLHESLLQYFNDRLHLNNSRLPKTYEELCKNYESEVIFQITQLRNNPKALSEFQPSISKAKLIFQAIDKSKYNNLEIESEEG